MDAMLGRRTTRPPARAKRATSGLENHAGDKWDKNDGRTQKIRGSPAVDPPSCRLSKPSANRSPVDRSDAGFAATHMGTTGYRLSPGCGGGTRNEVTFTYGHAMANNRPMQRPGRRGKRSSSPPRCYLSPASTVAGMGVT